MLSKVEHKLSANDIDLLLKRLTVTSINRVSTITLITIFFTVITII